MLGQANGIQNQCAHSSAQQQRTAEGLVRFEQRLPSGFILSSGKGKMNAESVYQSVEDSASHDVS